MRRLCLERVRGAAAPEQRRREAGRKVGLLPPLLGLIRPASGPSRPGSWRDRGDQEDCQRHPVLTVGDLDVAGRGDVEEVEGSSAEHRGEQRRPTWSNRSRRRGLRADRRRRSTRGARSRATGRSAPCRRRLRRARSRARPQASWSCSAGSPVAFLLHGSERTAAGIGNPAVRTGKSMSSGPAPIEVLTLTDGGQSAEDVARRVAELHRRRDQHPGARPLRRQAA